MPDHFYSAKRTLERAKYHFRDFESRVTAFANGEQGTYIRERDAKGIQYVHKIKFEPAFFEEAPSIVFDCINNMRAAIDQSLYAACITSGKPAADIEFLHFPVCKDESHFIDRMKGVAKAAPQEIQALIASFKPYKGGNNRIWNMNRLCNIKKHAILMPITTDPHGLEIHLVPGVVIFMTHKWVPENYEIEIIGQSRADFRHAHRITFRIAFDDTDAWVSGTNPIAVLKAFGHEAESVLVAMEGESRRLWPRAFE